MAKKKNPLDDYVVGRAPVHMNQQAGSFKDRRTKRLRDRSTQNRTAIEKSNDDE
jgi:hypothetical protein